ncbi:MAG: alcohol dehydrogenase catalytic domain-containing protein [Anaerovoracaceae bacterium]
MIQARVIKPGSISFCEVKDLSSKDLNPNEILLRIKKIGICGGDIHVMHGKHPFVTYPVIQGHEYGAEVVSVGTNVTKVKVGDKATARPQLVCEKCTQCRDGRYNVCQNLRVQGFQAPGAAQPYFIVPEDRIIKVDSSLSFEEIAMIEPCAVAAHATSKLELTNKNIVITGAGTIGNLVAQFSIARGAKNVLITDVSDLRLKKAQECGIKNVANTAKEDFQSAIEKVFAGESFQIGFEVSAAQACVTDLVTNIQKGGDIVIVAVFAEPVKVNLSELGEHELSMIGTMMYFHEDFELAAKMIKDKKITLDPLITQYFNFVEYPQAFEFIDNHREECMKVIIDI